MCQSPPLPFNTADSVCLLLRAYLAFFVGCERWGLGEKVFSDLEGAIQASILASESLRCGARF